MNPLSLLSGKVSNLKTQKGYKNFINASAGHAATQAGAIGAAASGAFFNSGVLTTASMIREGVTYYTCKINDVRVTGYLNNVAFKDTDEVEFVVEYDRQDKTQALAYAVRKPKERKLWVMDRMGDGTNIMKQLCWRFPLICMVVLMPFCLLMMMITSYFNNNGFDFLIEYWFFYLIIGWGGSSIFMYLIMVMGLHISFMPKAKIATKIIAALGYDNPEDESLAAISEDAKKQWEAENDKPFPPSDDLFVFYY